MIRKERPPKTTKEKRNTTPDLSDATDVEDIVIAGVLSVLIFGIVKWWKRILKK